MSDFDKRNDLTKAFFEEAARILDLDRVLPANSPALPNAGKTPTITQQETKLAAPVDGANRIL